MLLSSHFSGSTDACGPLSGFGLVCFVCLPAQVPVVFSGSLRANLDPARRLPDAQVWLALELCHLKETVQALPGQLLHPIQDGTVSLR